MKERLKREEQKSELEIKADRFLDLLYKYDYEGRDAYFKNPKYEMLFGGKPLCGRDSYNVIKGTKYVWMDAPYFRMGITKEGYLFMPKKYWSFGYFVGGNIDNFLDPELWGKNIVRVHTTARHGTGGPGVPFESAIFDYHDLRFFRNK